jgi:hypothetical protein
MRSTYSHCVPPVSNPGNSYEGCLKQNSLQERKADPMCDNKSRADMEDREYTSRGNGV